MVMELKKYNANSNDASDFDDMVFVDLNNRADSFDNK